MEMVLYMTDMENFHDKNLMIIQPQLSKGHRVFQ
jgi:hypothetical protein